MGYYIYLVDYFCLKNDNIQSTGVPVAFHHGANSCCMIKKIIQKLTNHDFDRKMLALEDLVPPVDSNHDDKMEKPVKRAEDYENTD